MDSLTSDVPPPGWVMATLGELGSWTGGGTPSKSRAEFWTAGTIPWVSPKDMKAPRVGEAAERITEDAVAQSATKLVPAGSLLCVVRSGILQHTFPVAIAERDVTLNQDMRALTPFAGVSAEFLEHYLRYRNDDVLHACSKDGTTVASIEQSRLIEFPVPLPPTPEQARIVAAVNAVFGEVEAGEAALARARESLTQFRASLLHAACTGALTADWRAANPTKETGSELLRRAFTNAPVAEAAPLWSSPATWAWTKVGLAGQVDLGRQRAPQHHDGPYMRPYLRVANVLEDRLDLSDVKHMNFDPDEFEHYVLRPGDILLNEGQAPDLIGRPAIYRGEIAGCCFQKTLLRFRASECCTSDFAQIVFMHYLHSGEFRKLAPITTNIAHLTRVRFVEMPFPVPPLEEQDAIVSATRSALESMGDGYLGSLAEPLQSLRQSILHAAFTGRLVPQNPDDEPASALLARLRTSPAAARATRKRRATAQASLIETTP